MSLLREVAGELVGMFLTDARLSGAVLALVALVALLTLGIGLPRLAAGALLLLGCLAILVEAVWHQARRS